MKIFSTALLLFTGFSLFLLSCQKDPAPATTSAKTTNITTSAWLYEGGGVDFDKNGSVDYPLPAGTLAACQLDNTLKFNKDNTGVADEGTTKCNASDPQTATFRWNFADNENSLQVNGNLSPVLNGSFKILALTATNFSLSKDTVLSSQNVAIIVNLKH
jgi:hypothetical protein